MFGLFRVSVSVLPVVVVAATVFVSGRDVQAMDDDGIIQVYSCDPGMIELGEGPNMVCIPEGGGGGGPGGGGPGSGDHDGSGPGGPSPSDNAAAERQRKQRCEQCTANAQKCLHQAVLAKSTCWTNAETLAIGRCNVLQAGGVTRTVTAGGCAI